MILQDSIQVIVSLSHNEWRETILKWCCVRCEPFNFFSSPSPVDIILTKCLCHSGKRFKSTVWAFFNTRLSCVCAHLSTIIMNWYWQGRIAANSFLLQMHAYLFSSRGVHIAPRDHFGLAATLKVRHTWYPFLASRWKLSSLLLYLVPYMIDDLFPWPLSRLS